MYKTATVPIKIGISMEKKYENILENYLYSKAIKFIEQKKIISDAEIENIDDTNFGILKKNKKFFELQKALHNV